MVMSKVPKHPYDDMIKHATRIADTISPFCERIEIAGSLRRQRKMIGDIEIVAIPRRPVTVFGEPIVGAPNDLAIFLNSKIRKDQYRLNGDKLKSWYSGGVQVDLFLPERANWGWRYMLSTGSGDFNKWLVTKRAWRGAMPANMKSEGGFLWRDGEKLETPTEQDVFDALGLPFIPATSRDNGEWFEIVNKEVNND
jgi:DNA polymerase/3'-5' exonuclease PolX